MKFEDFYNYTRLFDIYGKLLSNKQYEVMNKFLNHDLGESELAELLGDSRQSVHDAITKAKKQLVLFEEKCGFLHSQMITKEKLLVVKAFLKTQPNSEKVLGLIEDILDNN